MLKKKRNQKGQAAIEFIVVVVVILFFLLFFMSMSLVLVVSDYMEYATFMTARTYKAMMGGAGSQEKNARTVFNSYANRVQGIARNFNITFLPGDDRGDQGAGVRVEYDVDLFYLPPLFLPNGVPGGVIRLRSETRLGKDPSGQETQTFFQKLAQRFGVEERFITQMDDNGF